MMFPSRRSEALQPHSPLRTGLDSLLSFSSIISDKDILLECPGYGPVNPMKRLVRTLMLGGVGAGRNNSRLPDLYDFVHEAGKLKLL